MQKGVQGKYLAGRQQTGEHSQGVRRRRRVCTLSARANYTVRPETAIYPISINIPIAHAAAVRFRIITDTHTNRHCAPDDTANSQVSRVQHTTTTIIIILYSCYNGYIYDGATVGCRTRTQRRRPVRRSGVLTPRDIIRYRDNTGSRVSTYSRAPPVVQQ